MTENNKNKFFLPVATLVVLIAFLLGMYTQQLNSKFKNQNAKVPENQTASKEPNLTKLQEEVLPKSGYTFNIYWGDLGRKMVEDGVIDEVKLAKALTGTEELTDNFKKYFDNSSQKQIQLDQQTAHFWVDVLWGLGLANKSKILDEGPMIEEGSTANFASTGGYTLGTKEPMDIYSKFSYFNLSEKQEVKVKEIASNVFRPCCGNSTAFPDCNHGMAALGLIELMVSQNKSDNEIYKTVLAFNQYWFPQTYLDISYHFAKNGRNYKDVSAKEILSNSFSSGMGYQALKKRLGEINWPALSSGGSCGA